MSAVGEAAVARPTRLGRYELITRIGQGGMAEVQLALQRGPAGFEKLVVVKLVHDSLATQKAFVDMLLDEARVAALVKHPNVVDIYDLGQAEGRFFIAMEYLEGEPLLAVLRAGREGKRLDPLSTGRLIADTAEGLDAAHELRSMSGERLELVHHDISLGNIVVLYNGQVKLVDFGVAKATQSAQSKAKVQGKFSYMAPEKLKGAPGDRRSDIFSLGCVMWEALTLKRLFRGGNDAETMKQVLEMTIQPPSKVNADVPPEYDEIVMRSLDRDPSQRHSTAKELAVEIEELLRKRGYGAKNDRVAKYMQETFKSHIDARKKLVHEVVSKGSASAEIVDAAFSEGALASGSPMTPPASEANVLDFPQGAPAKAAEAAPVATNAWADSSKPTVISAPPVFDQATKLDARPLDDDLLKISDAADVETTPQGPSFAARAKAILANKKQRMSIAIGGAVLLLVIVIIAVSGGGDGDKATTAKVATGGSSDLSGSAIVGAHEAEPQVPALEPGSAAEPDIVIEPATPKETAKETPKDPPKETRKETRPPKEARTPKEIRQSKETAKETAKETESSTDVENTVNKGLQAFVKGDARGALALLQKAKSAKPGYAPTYRVLGKVYKKLGDKSSAKKAFQRYLALAPSAADADQIREEIKTL
ncbi:MAG: protein kinase [Kofleriaceae bacterium]|nr:protein kinase [Kofleriaceae bacterium]